MFISNQKYLVVKYEFSSDFSDYLSSITSFIYKLMRTYKDASLNENRFYHIDIPTGEDKLTYFEEEDNSKLSLFMKSIIKEELYKQIEISRDAIFIFDDLIIYNERKKSTLRQIDQQECETKTVYDTTFKVLTVKLNENNILKNKILEFWKCKIDSFTYKILQSYIDEKIDISKLLVADKNFYIDFLELSRDTFIDDKLMFDDDNKISLSDKFLDKFFEKTNIVISGNELNVDYINYNDDEVEEIGLYIDGKIYLYDFCKNIPRINKTQKVLFDYFKQSIKVDFEKQSNNIIDFTSIREKNKDVKLTKILSELENNLYLKEIKHDKLDSEIQEFFQTSYLVQNREFEHIHFFISEEGSQNKFLLGIVNNSNERLHDGRSVKGLKCWIDKDSKEIKSFENYERIDNAAKLVCHLSPEYAFYFKEKFFEDYLEDILKEIQSEETDLKLEYIANNKFYFSKDYISDSALDTKHQKGKIEQEFDFIVNIEKDGVSKNIVLEAKTKLSKFIADTQRQKIQKYMKHDNLKIFDEYLLIGFNHDNTMNDLQYFQKKYPIQASQDKIDIAFRYPLPATDDKILYCMASTNYDNLKKSLVSFFRTELYE